MKILGITGSIGSGKSHFCKKLSRIRGIKVISSDEMVHRLYEDSNFAQKLIGIFGREIASESLKTPSYDGVTQQNDHWVQQQNNHQIQQKKHPSESCCLHDGICKPEQNHINRKKLGEIVFKDPQKKKELENLVYPELARRRKEIIKLLNRQRFNGILVLEIPLLFENKLEKECDYTLTVFCNPTIQKQRVLRRSGMTAEKYNSILKTQMSVAEKIKRSDFSYNSGSFK